VTAADVTDVHLLVSTRAGADGAGTPAAPTVACNVAVVGCLTADDIMNGLTKALQPKSVPIGDVIVKGAISPAFDPKYEVDGKLKVAPGWLHANAVPRRLALWDVRKAPTDEDKRMFVPLLGVAKTYGGSWRDEENNSNNMDGKLDEKGHMTKDKKPNMHSATGYREHIAPKFPGTRVRDWKYTLHRPNLGFHNLREVRAVKANLKPRTEPRSKYYY
jgi:hypothetical protein